MTTPIPAFSLSLKITPSKFILQQFGSGSHQIVGGLGGEEVRQGCAFWYS